MVRIFSLWLLLGVSALASAQPTILVLGDSLSSAYGMRSEQGWVALLQTKLDNESYTHRVINASVTGDTTDGGLSRLPDMLERERPEVVIVELGGNDGLRAFAAKRIKANLTKIINLSQAADAKVLLLGIKIPGNYGPFYTRAFNNIYADIADDTGSELVPFFMDGVALNRQLIQDDGIHPNAKAQPKLLDNVWPRLTKLLD